MNKQKLQNEINKTKEHLANMEKMLKDCEYERWKPNIAETYYFVDNDLMVISDDWVNIESQCTLYNTYNCFQTREQAEAEAEKILVRRMLEDIARRLNKGEEIYWDNGKQPKYILLLDTYDGEITFNTVRRFKNQGAIYCLDKNFLDVAIQEIGEERLKKYLSGE